MTTSPNFAYNRNQICFRSLRQVGAIAQGETPGAQELSDTVDALNAMVAGWQASGLHLWKEKEGTLFLQPMQYNYGLGGAGASGGTTIAYVTPTPNLIMLTTTSATLAAGTTAFPVLSSAGVNIGDNFGIMQSNNQLFWGVVSAVATGQVTVSGAGTTQVVNPSANAFDFPQLVTGTPASCAIYRPLRVLNVRRILWSSLIETMVTSMSRLDYRNQPDKTTTGVVTQFFYDPQEITGQFWAWPNPQDSRNGLNFTYMEPIYDFNTAADYPDFPQEWINALVWNLSDEIGIEYDIPDNRAARIAQKAAQSLDLVMGFDREPESFFLGVNFDQTRR